MSQQDITTDQAKSQRDLAMEYMLKQAKAKENFVACYLKETGLSIEDVMLVEHPSDDGKRIEWSCMPKLKVKEKETGKQIVIEEKDRIVVGSKVTSLLANWSTISSFLNGDTVEYQLALKTNPDIMAIIHHNGLHVLSCRYEIVEKEKVMETPVDVKKAKWMKEDLEKELSAELTRRIGEFEKATGLVVRNVEAFTVHELVVGEGTPKFVFAEVGLGVEI